MAKFKVQITETLQKIVEVEAENEYDAQDIVESEYSRAVDDEFILDADCYLGTEFEVVA